MLHIVQEWVFLTKIIWTCKLVAEEIVGFYYHVGRECNIINEYGMELAVQLIVSEAIHIVNGRMLDFKYKQLRKQH